MRKYTPEEQALVESFREGPCEVCGRSGETVGHHIFTFGAGGPTVRWNLIAVCAWCHTRIDSGFPSRWVLLCVVGQREKIAPDEIEALVYAHRRAKRKLP